MKCKQGYKCVVQVHWAWKQSHTLTKGTGRGMERQRNLKVCQKVGRRYPTETGWSTIPQEVDIDKVGHAGCHLGSN